MRYQREGDLAQRQRVFARVRFTVAQAHFLRRHVHEMRCDVSSRASASALHARATAPPDITMQREPQVPVEYGVTPVSPCTTRTCSGSMPRISFATCASVVSMPWPCECAPMRISRRRRASGAHDTARAPAPSECPSRDRPTCRARPARSRWRGRRRCGDHRAHASSAARASS